MKPIIIKVLASAALLTLAACAGAPATHAGLPQTVKTVAPLRGVSTPRKTASAPTRGGRNSATP